MKDRITYMEENEARKEIVAWGRELYQMGLVCGSGGNISVRIGENTVLLTPTGYFLGHMTPECISKTDFEGNALEGPKPTKEVPLHLAVYRTNPNIRAVVHTHSVYAISLSNCIEPGDIMPVYTPAVAAKVGLCRVAPLELPGSDALGRATEDGIRGAKAVLLSNHGVVTAGKNLQDAVSVAYEIEENAKIHFITAGEGRMVPEDALRELARKAVI